MSTERPWLSKYMNGVPANIDPDKYPSLVAWVEDVFKKYKKEKAFSNFGVELTYGEIDKLSNQFGAYLISRGLEAGDRIAIMMPNLLQYPIAIFGAIRAGLVVVNTNPLYTPREMQHQFIDSGVKAVLIAENFAANLEKILPATEIKTIITTTIGEMLGTIKGSIVDATLKYVKKLVPKHNLPNTVNFKDALKQGKKFTIPAYQGGPDTVILHQYTGGTTGVAKGAMLTNRNLVANMEQVKAILQPILEERKEIALSPLPMYHIYAFSCNCLALGAVGAMNVLVTNPRDLGSIVKEFKRYKINLFTGVNTLFNALVNLPEFKDIDFSGLKGTSGGGMAVQPVVGEKWEQITGCFLAEGYGLTETSPVLTANPSDGSGRLGTIGIPVPSTELRIVDEDGKPLPVGESGEIQARGPQVMKGYYNRPEETAKVINSEGWFSTGDIGLMEEDGFFRIVDRKKDMILVSGFNVYPNEIEDVVSRHPKVLEVAAVGKQDDKSGECVMLFIVKKDKSLTEKEIKEYCRENLTAYKNPKFIEFKEELPKTNVGKILRKDLREEANKS